MSGSPEYVARLKALPFDPLAGFDDLDIAWNRLINGAITASTFNNIASISFSMLAIQRMTDPRKTQIPKHAWDRTLDEAIALHVGKNDGYAGGTSDPWSNFRDAALFGVTPLQGVLVRMSDKMARIRSLRRNPANDRVNEPIWETLRDLGAYALIALCIQQEKANAYARNQAAWHPAPDKA